MSTTVTFQCAIHGKAHVPATDLAVVVGAPEDAPFVIAHCPQCPADETRWIVLDRATVLELLDAGAAQQWDLETEFRNCTEGGAS